MSRRRTPQSREEQIAMFAKQKYDKSAKAHAAYKMLTKKQHASLKELVQSQGLKLDTKGMGELVKRMRVHWSAHTGHGVAGKAAWRTDLNRKLAATKWRYLGGGAGRFVIGDPYTKLALKIAKPLIKHSAFKRRESYQTIHEARRLKELTGKSFKIKTRGITLTGKAPRIYAVSPTGKYVIVEYARGTAWRPTKKFAKKARGKFRVSDINKSNLKKQGKTVKLIDIGYSVTGKTPPSSKGPRNRNWGTSDSYLPFSSTPK